MTDKKHHHKNCILIFKKLSEYLDDELDDQTYQELSSHLKECTRCQVCLETLKRTIELLRNLKTGNITEKLKEPIKWVAP